MYIYIYIYIRIYIHIYIYIYINTHTSKWFHVEEPALPALVAAACARVQRPEEQTKINKHIQQISDRTKDKSIQQINDLASNKHKTEAINKAARGANKDKHQRAGRYGSRIWLDSEMLSEENMGLPQFYLHTEAVQ